MRKAACIPLMSLLLVGPGGCSKQSSEPEASAAKPRARSAAAAGMRPAPRRRAAARSARAACAKGARPDQAVEKEQYRLTVKVPAAVRVGQTVNAQIEVTPKAGYKVNLKYPAELRLAAAPAGVKLPQRKLAKKQAAALTKERLRFEVPLQATDAGEHVVSGEVDFSVCTPKLCITEPDTCVAWEITGK